MQRRLASIGFEERLQPGPPSVVRWRNRKGAVTGDGGAGDHAQGHCANQTSVSQVIRIEVTHNNKLLGFDVSSVESRYGRSMFHMNRGSSTRSRNPSSSRTFA